MLQFVDENFRKVTTSIIYTYIIFQISKKKSFSDPCSYITQKKISLTYMEYKVCFILHIKSCHLLKSPSEFHVIRFQKHNVGPMLALSDASHSCELRQRAP